MHRLFLVLVSLFTSQPWPTNAEHGFTIDRSWKPPQWLATDRGGGSPYRYNVEAKPPKLKTCEVASGAEGGDDTPAILSAFWDCRENGHVVFANTTYYIKQVMNTTGLKNVDIELKGTLEWDAKNISYWTNNSLPVGFQNQSSAWFLGGENIHFYGHGYGTLFGNGDDWYIWNNGRSNVKGRPHAITFWETTNSLISGLRFIKSQMWTMTVTRSENVELTNIYINNSCSAEAKEKASRCNVNTDGIDTIYANNITMSQWTVESGDDSISMKQNSTNIYMANNTFVKGLAYAMGSIGQYLNELEIIENITAVDTVLIDTAYGGRIKTWTGRSTGSPPNGGGGGIGWARNITFANFTMKNVDIPWWITQCTSYNGVTGGCDTSKFAISNLNWGPAKGTTRGLKVAQLQCSKAVNCTNVHIFGNDLKVQKNGTRSSEYLCSNVDARGFNCTGKAPDWSG